MNHKRGQNNRRETILLDRGQPTGDIWKGCSIRVLASTVTVMSPGDTELESMVATDKVARTDLASVVVISDLWSLRG